MGILWTKLNKQSQEVKDLIKALEKKRQFQEDYNQYALLILLRVTPAVKSVQLNLGDLNQAA